METTKKDDIPMNDKKINVVINKRTFEIKLIDEHKVRINENLFDIEHIRLDAYRHSFIINGKSYEVILKERTDDKQFFILNGKQIETEIQNEITALLKKFQSVIAQNENYVIIAPMPGFISNINVIAGEKVQSGTKLCVLEAMKMENDIVSQREGVVKEIFVKEKTIVEKGMKIMQIK
jgi:biotin carboxyl carrier protein